MKKRARELEGEKDEGFQPTPVIEKVRNGLRNTEVKCKPKRTPPTPPHLPKLPLLAGAFGVCKSGKSNALVNLIKAYTDAGSINFLYCISPTYHSNASLQTLPFIDERRKTEKEEKANYRFYETSVSKRATKQAFVGIFTDPNTSVAALETIIRHIKQKNKEYKDEQAYKKLHKKWQKGVLRLTAEEWSYLDKEEFRDPIDVPWPQPGIFIDDMTHTPLMANSLNNVLSHLSLHHRHLDGVGVSIFQAFQTFKSGMPRVVRTNMSLIMLFPTCNMKEIEEIYAEVSNNITFDTFKKMLFEATKETHGFLMINKMADDCTRQFGINFDKVFVVDPVAERGKLLGYKTPT